MKPENIELIKTSIEKRVEEEKRKKEEQERMAAAEIRQREKLVKEIRDFFRGLPTGKYIINIGYLGLKWKLMQIKVYGDKSMTISFGNNMDKENKNDINSVADLTSWWDYKSIIEVWKNLERFEEQLVKTYGDGK